jgi:Kef-type K+ transport system membrane component KefB
MFDQFIHNLGSPVSTMLLQIVAILVVAKACGSMLRFFGQPQVVGEMLAGILLGPSLLKPLAPEVHAFLFPPSSLDKLFFLSQIGILIYMFVVGLELNVKSLQSKARSAVAISLSSIVLPFALGIGAALLLFDSYGPRSGDTLGFALFMGIAMSITAFPVLARILQEQGLAGSRLGSTAIACAATDDIVAWCVLAIVVGVVQSGSAFGAAFTIICALAYVTFMFAIVRPLLRKWLQASGLTDPVSSGFQAFAFLALFLSAWITETIGIHALFGAFIVGVVIPDGNGFKAKIVDRILDVTSMILLPLFFAFTGLRTQLGLLHDPQSLLVCGLILALAVLGKLGGAAVAARFTGHDWRTSTILGLLLNTRGLMELIVLNLGYDLGLLGPKIFAIMVVMALITTMMTGPLVRWLLAKPVASLDAEAAATPTF